MIAESEVLINSINTTEITGIINFGQKIVSRNAWSIASAAAGYMYDYLSKPTPFSVIDRGRYHNLVMAYQRLGIPMRDFWLLDDSHRPHFKIDYLLLKRRLDTAIDRLMSSSSEIRLAQASILSLLTKYMESMHKRRLITNQVYGGAVREDGVESMFFAEFVDWFLDNVPELADLDEATILAFEKRASYCQEVYALVTPNQAHSNERSNPKDTLQRLKSQMNAYHKNLVQRREAMNFNARINQLNDCLLGLSAKSFHFMYGLIEKSTNTPFIVEQFLDPYESDQQVRAIRATQLGRWLYQTLRQAGVLSSTFESEAILSLDMISKHLARQHPKDSDCNLSEYATDATSKRWGHLEFVCKPYISEPAIDPIDLEHVLLDEDDSGVFPEPSLNPKKAAEGYLQQFRQLYKLILQINFVRQNLVRTAAVANVFGEKWAYGDAVGQAALDVLLTSVLEVTKEYNKTLRDFWNSYYVKHYTPYARKSKKHDVNSPGHRWLTRINCEYLPSIMENINEITQSLKEIRNQSKKLPQNLICVEKTKKALLLDLIAFMKFQEKEDSPNFSIIQNAISELDESSSEQDLHSKDDESELTEIKHAIEERISTLKRDSAEITKLTSNYLKKQGDEVERHLLLIERQTKERSERMDVVLSNYTKKLELTLETTQIISAEIQSQISDVKKIIERNEMVHAIKETSKDLSEVRVELPRNQTNSPSFFRKVDDSPSLVPSVKTHSLEAK